MLRALFVVAVAALSQVAGIGAAAAENGKCRLVRTLKDGRVIQSMIDDNSTYARVSRSGQGVRASSASSSNRSSSSSVSVSSSSSSSSSSRSGGGSARAESTRTDAQGRKITVISDDDGCTVRVDERNT